MKTILTDGVKWVSSASDASAYTQLYSSPSPGLDRDGQRFAVGLSDPQIHALYGQ